MWAGVDISNGIHDDVSRVASSILTGEPLPIAYVGVTLFAALSSAYLGVQIMRALGARSDLAFSGGAVAGSLALDMAAKYYHRKAP